MKEFFTIGEISKLFNINKKTLRYYDEIDLFKPSYVDEHNKYRYYSIDQFECLETIQYLKELGLTLNKRCYTTWFFRTNKRIRAWAEMCDWI